ncbi:valine--tRNA ligase [Spiroplasma endosymbiont of Labia minor]|uniref:valine--tRNA ligase n=1 Tax=Spiroplasma endosymbiont of Labia minor TaxID=3066305 RepID=UPI0030D34962
MLDKKYDGKLIEKDMYKQWIEQKIFEANPHSQKEPFSIVIPPPNVTGKLHLGHALDYSIQDLLIRFKKLKGYDTLWIPGMDHAGIATQAKVEQKLKEQGISRYDIGRDKFVEEIWKWKEEYAQIIREQWGKLGLSLDYSQEAFTYSDDLNKIVNKVFVEMYNKNLIYKAKRIINWDMQLKTALSNIEVIYKEIDGEMFYVKYLSQDKKMYLLVATTRPETMFGDVCLVANPHDERFGKYIGKKFINPANNELIELIADEYVDIEFGTGIMKCTPAHDQNDYEIGVRHNLTMPIIMNEDGTMNEFAGEYVNLDRFEVRKKLINQFEQEDILHHIEKIKHQVGFSERSNTIVEPYLSEQWFVKMSDLAKQVVDNQKSDNAIDFFPNRFNDTLNSWMTNTYDWTISRQLWWGHRIPVWYKKDNKKEVYVGELPPVDVDKWIQDEDVLDTWFSSALWPFSTLGWNSKDKTYFKRYFPTSVLVTGYDIIFFWVARMIFQSLQFTNQIPFKKVLIHGLIRDEQGRKMSKSLGNGIDPMDVIDEYGADSLRFSLLTNTTPGQDLKFSQEKIKASWNFVNKLWNASRFVFLNLADEKIEDKIDIKKATTENAIDLWILHEFSIFKNEMNDIFEKFEFSLAGKKIYDFIWNKYCSWYIEMSKVNLESSDALTKLFTLTTLKYVLKNILIICHPIIPFVTETLYKKLTNTETILKSEWSNDNFEFDDLYFNDLISIIESIREFRQLNNLLQKKELKLIITNINEKNNEIFNNNIDSINKYLKKIINADISFDLSSSDRFSIPLKNFILEIDKLNLFDSNQIKKELEKKFSELTNEIIRSEKILRNEDFINKASSEKILSEQNKYDSYLEQLEKIKKRLKNL